MSEMNKHSDGEYSDEYLRQFDANVLNRGFGSEVVVSVSDVASTIDDTLETVASQNGELPSPGENSPENIRGGEDMKKGILKHARSDSNKHVDFNMDLEFVPFDEAKDFTIEIQIVEKMPKKVVSYAALFAEQKAQEEVEDNVKTEVAKEEVDKHPKHSKSEKQLNKHATTKTGELHVKASSTGIKGGVHIDAAVIKNQKNKEECSVVSVNTKGEKNHCQSEVRSKGVDDKVHKEESHSGESGSHCGVSNIVQPELASDDHSQRTEMPTKEKGCKEDIANCVRESHLGGEENNLSEQNILHNVAQSVLKLDNKKECQKEYNGCNNPESSTGDILKEFTETIKAEHNGGNTKLEHNEGTTKAEHNEGTTIAEHNEKTINPEYNIDCQKNKEIQNITCINLQKESSLLAVKDNSTSCKLINGQDLSTSQDCNENKSNFEETEASNDSNDNSQENRTDHMEGGKIKPTDISESQARNSNEQIYIGPTEVNNERENLEMNCSLCDLKNGIPSEVGNNCTFHTDNMEINNNQHNPRYIVDIISSNNHCEKLDVVESNLENKESETNKEILLEINNIPEGIEKPTLPEAIGKDNSTSCTNNEQCKNLSQENRKIILNEVSHKNEKQLPILLINGLHEINSSLKYSEKDYNFNEKVVENQLEENENVINSVNDIKADKIILNEEKETLERDEVISKICDTFELGDGRVSEERRKE